MTKFFQAFERMSTQAISGAQYNTSTNKAYLKYDQGSATASLPVSAKENIISNREPSSYQQAKALEITRDRSAIYP